MIVVYAVRYFPRRSSLSRAHGPTTLFATMPALRSRRLPHGNAASGRPGGLELGDQRLALHGIRDVRSHDWRMIIVGLAVQFAACATLSHATPLLEEEGDVRSRALPLNVDHPFALHGAS